MSGLIYKAEADKVNDYFATRELADAEMIALGQMNATLAQRNAILAQVEATERMVEQQRIANLQRERAHALEQYRNSGNSSQSAARDTVALDAQIREGLGLG